MDEEKIKAVKTIFRCVDGITPWDKIREGDIVHIPPIISLERRDICVLEKKDDELSYKRIDKVNSEEGTLHRTSIFAKIMIKRKNY